MFNILELSNHSNQRVAAGSQHFVRQGKLNAAHPFNSFRVNLGHRSSLDLDMTRLKSDANLLLLSQQGKILKQSRRAGKKPESITTELAAGTYYVRTSLRKGTTLNTQRSASFLPHLKGKIYTLARYISISDICRKASQTQTLECFRVIPKMTF